MPSNKKNDFDKQNETSVHKFFTELTQDVGCIMRRNKEDNSLQKIIIIKPSTKEEVVMIFGKAGQMRRFFYKAPDSQIRMTYDAQQKRYVSLPNPSKIKMAYALVNNKFQPIGPSKHQKPPKQGFFWYWGSESMGNSFLIHNEVFQIHLDHNNCLNTEASRYAKQADVVQVYDDQTEASEKKRILQTRKMIIYPPHLRQNHSR